LLDFDQKIFMKLNIMLITLALSSLLINLILINFYFFIKFGFDNKIKV